MSAAQDDFHVSDDDESGDMVVVSGSTTVEPSVKLAPVSDLAFVAALAQAELELINSVEEEEEESECSMGEEETHNIEPSTQEKEMETESDSSSSSEDEDEDEGTDRKMMVNSDDEDDAPVSSAILRTKNEIIMEDVEPVGVELTAAEELSLVGEVMSVVATENTIVIQSIRTQTPLDEGSVLCLGDRKIIGKISELFGPLSSPFYVVKVSSSSSSSSAATQKKTTHPSSTTDEEEEENEKDVTGEEKEEVEVKVVAREDNMQVPTLQHADIDDIHPGVSVYVAVQHSSYVTPYSLSLIKKMKGSDASNMWDEEIGDDEREFSDDEQEAAYRKNKKNLKRNVGSGSGSGGGAPSIGGQRDRDMNRDTTGASAGSGASRDGGGGSGFQHNTGGNSSSSGSRQVPYGQLNIGQSGTTPAYANTTANMYTDRQYRQTSQAYSSASSGVGMNQQQHHHQQQQAPPPSSSYGSVHAGPPLMTTSSSTPLPPPLPLPPPATFIPPPQRFQWPAEGTGLGLQQPFQQAPLPQQQQQQQQYPQAPSLGGQLYQPHQQQQPGMYQQGNVMPLQQGGMYSAYAPGQQPQYHQQQQQQCHQYPPPAPPASSYSPSVTQQQSPGNSNSNSNSNNNNTGFNSNSNSNSNTGNNNNNNGSHFVHPSRRNP